MKIHAKVMRPKNYTQKHLKVSSLLELNKPEKLLNKIERQLLKCINIIKIINV